MAKALAFERSVKLYQMALQTDYYNGRRKREIFTELGETLINEGRAKDAAQAFLNASESGFLETEEALDLQRRAAEQLLMGGHLNEGLAVTKVVLSAVGLSLPKSPNRAIARVIWERTESDKKSNAGSTRI